MKKSQNRLASIQDTLAATFHRQTIFTLVLFITGAQLLSACGGQNNQEEKEQQTTTITTTNENPQTVNTANTQPARPAFDAYHVVKTNEGLRIWGKVKPDGGQGQLYIMSPSDDKVLKKIDLPAELLDWMYQVDDYFFCLGKRLTRFEIREVLTGELVASNALLEKKFEELAEGIAKVDRRHNGWLPVMTIKGKWYYYNPSKNRDKLEAKRPVAKRYGRFTNTWVYGAVHLEKPDNKAEKRVVLVRHKYAYSSKYLRSIRNQQKLRQEVARGKVKVISPADKGKYYMKTKVQHADSSGVLFTYLTQFGENGVRKLAYQNADGTVRWDIGSDKTSELGKLITRWQFTFDGKNTLALRGYDHALGLDLRTGKVAWKFYAK